MLVTTWDKMFNAFCFFPIGVPFVMVALLLYSFGLVEIK